MPELDQTSLHHSLQDPVLGSMERLKGIAARFPDAISFGLGAPHPGQFDELDVFRHVERYLTHLRNDRGLSRGQARRLLYEYGPSAGLINDLVAAALHRDDGIAVSPESIVITVGAQEALLLALRAVCRDRGDALGLADPSFYGVLGAARLLDIDVVALSEDENGLDVDALERRCARANAQGQRVRVVYAAPDFANPSGSVMDLATRHRLLRLADRADLMIIEDNAYRFTADPGAELPTLKSLDEHGRVLYVGTFAKVCAPGARVGFVVADRTVPTADGPRPLAGQIALLKSVTTVNTAPLCQAMIGGVLLENGCSLAALGAGTAATYRRNLGVLLDSLDRHLTPTAELSWNHPAGGFFVHLRIPVPADEALLERSAAGYGVLWTPLESMYVGGGGTHCIRLSCSALDPPAIREGVRRLAGFLADLTPGPPGPAHPQAAPLLGRSR